MAHDLEETITGIDPDESPTPGWFTLLGVVLLLGAGAFVLVGASGDDEPTGPGDAAEAAAAPSEAPAAAPEE